MRWPAVFLVLPSVAACADFDTPVAVAGGGLAKDSALPSSFVAIAPTWPLVTPLPACVPGVFEVPELSTSGALRMTTGGLLQATHVTQTLHLRLPLPGTSTLDATASGPVVVTVDTGMTLLSNSELQGGEGVARVRFDTAGLHEVTAVLADGRGGKAQFQAYDSQLPIWEAEIAPADLLAMWADPSAKQLHPTRLRVAGGPWHEAATVRVQGGGSVDFAKKSFRFTMASGDELAGERSINLRAEYVDKTMLRTWLGYELFRSATWLPTPASEFVHLRINGDYYGLMNHVQRIGTGFLAQHGRDPEGELYESDPPHDMDPPGGNLAPLATLANYAKVYELHAGARSYAGLVEFIEGVLQAPDAQFFTQIGAELQVDAWLAYAAAMAVLQNHEHIRKNFYIYRDPGGPEPRWEFLPWDLDLTWGHLWNEELDVLNEAVVADAPLEVGMKMEGHDFQNRMYRLLAHPAFRQRFRGFVKTLAEATLTPAFVDNRIDAALCRIRLDLLADRNKRASNAEYLDRVQEIREFAAQRLAFVRQAAAK